MDRHYVITLIAEASGLIRRAREAIPMEQDRAERLGHRPTSLGGHPDHTKALSDLDEALNVLSRAENEARYG